MGETYSGALYALGKGVNWATGALLGSTQAEANVLDQEQNIEVNEGIDEWWDSYWGDEGGAGADGIADAEVDAEAQAEAEALAWSDDG